ncbi:MAG: flavodoxin family protein [Desulfobacterales bacterium]|nr:flavodoxin family protein [Desulfobacterales bacterium]
MENQIPKALQFSHKQRYVRLEPASVKKVLVLQGSPRKEGTSKTDIVAGAFAAGCRRAGAETETIYLREKKIKQCQGCFHCWTKSPGKCIHDDDVADIMKAAEGADLVVYASPLYHFGIISLMKRYIERTLPGIEPFLIKRDDGKTTHPPRKGFKYIQNAAIIGVCGFPEVEHFGAFSANFHYIANAGGEFGMNIAAEIYRPLSEILGNPFYREENDRVIGAVEKAGCDLIVNGYVAPSLIDEIAEVRLDKEAIYEMANKSWQICIDKCMTMSEFQEELAET